VLKEVRSFCYRVVYLIGSSIKQAVALAYALLRRRKSWIRQIWTGDKPLEGARHVAVFNHFDRRGDIADYVVYYLKDLDDAGYRVIFVTNSTKLPEASVERLRPLTALIVHRHNLGYDFGAYKEGINQIPDLEALDSLIIANDSVYGPVRPLRDVLPSASVTQAEVWSMTDSWERRFHLQSYFLLFYAPAIRHPRFRRFWDSVLYVQSKSYIIRRYEIGLTFQMIAAGMRCRALFPYRQAAMQISDLLRSSGKLREPDLPALEQGYIRAVYWALETGRPLNPTHFFWDHLITRMGCPFIKRELLVKNPAKVPMLSYWERAIAQVGDYDTEMIQSHLQRSMRNRSV
jgi:lipopolysaccharide biosynthesis protein